MQSVDLDNLKPKQNSITEFLDDNKCHTRVNKDTSFKSLNSCFDFKFTSKKYSFIIANLFETSNSKMQVGEFQVCRLHNLQTVSCESISLRLVTCNSTSLWVASCESVSMRLVSAPQIIQNKSNKVNMY